MVLMLSTPGTATVPPPYTSIRATAGKFICLGRETELGPMLLPAQIESAGKKILASPVCLAVEPTSALDGLTGAGRVVANSGDSAAWEWQGQSKAFKVGVRLTAECDGFCWYEVTLAPEQPIELSSIRLEIPRRAETTRYLHAACFAWGRQTSRGLEELGGNWRSKFMPYVWLGDEERGLAWCCESDRGWRLKEPANALRVETIGDTVQFSASLLDHTETVDAPMTLRFGLQASPVKPVSFEWRAGARIFHGVSYRMAEPNKRGRIPLDTLRNAGVKTAIYHDMWTDYYGKVSTPNPERLRKFIDECHKRGIRVLVYIGYGLARSAPELQGRHDEWSVMPLIPWETSYRGEYRNFDACCARSGWAEWLVSGIDRLFTDYALDGLYFDGTSEAWRCQNESHGCGWRDDEGNLHNTYPLLAVRRMMRRIADVVHRRRPDAILDVHMSASLTLPTLSFCDSYYDGEQYEVYTAADEVEVPLDAFRTEFMGYAHGLDAQFLCYLNRPFTFNEAIAMAWLHGVEVRPLGLPGLRAIIPIWGAHDRFGTPSAKWLPYWSGSGVTADDPSVKASAFVKEGGALIFVSHLRREPLATVLHLDRRKLGLREAGLNAVDAVTGKRLRLTDLTLPISFDGMNWRLIEVR